ncbi:IclR family transcriptional regulator [Endozoicomonas acroporae]|uniref:IclR family transcriptional regulator n=1 Tax=Endozoicomonas acroporae TaxID=1701104 RepID=UPI000C78ABCD|nr:IclR family transcriptional regulator [Endozoicomonas acroporae]
MIIERRKKGSSITRVLEIIESVAQAERPLSPADLALLLDIPKPSVHRILQQLVAEGYLQTNIRGLLIPADRLQATAFGILHSSRFKALSQAVLQKLAHKTGETCGISIPNGTEMIYYDRVQTNWPLQVHLPIGSHTPVWCTASGKLYLSSLPKDDRQRIINNLPMEMLARNTITTAKELESTLLEIADNDRGVENEEFIDGMASISVPVRNEKDRLTACLFTHAPILRKSLTELLQFEPLLRQAALELGSFEC